MKKWTLFLMWISLALIALPAQGAMSLNKMRQNTRFLTDRMAHELRLSPQQYDDVYEVNYDFINNIRYLMDDVVRGYDYALDRYYDFLDVRNDDLRWILTSAQYRRFMSADHFYRPVYTTRNKWQFRIFNVYTNVNFFYFGKPHHYLTYTGNHYRTHFNNVSYYKLHHSDRYRHEVYKGDFRIRTDRAQYDRHRHNDFHATAPRAPQKPKPAPKPTPHAQPGRPVKPQAAPSPKTGHTAQPAPREKRATTTRDTHRRGKEEKVKPAEKKQTTPHPSTDKKRETARRKAA